MTHPSTQRRGAILLIVLVLLALFAVIGLAFVLYAQAEATSARIHREAMNSSSTAPDPTAAVNSFLGQLLYPVADGSGSQIYGIGSALRGHDLARLAYGYNPNSTNTNAYNGLGMFSQSLTGPGNRLQCINFTANLPSDTVVDPEFTGTRTATQIYSGMPSSGVFVGKNAPYTYPDRNNAFLAMMDPATGIIQSPSFHRPSLFSTLASTNPNWTLPAGRYRILRPRPYDHIYDSGDGRGAVSDFPYPPANPDGTITGDVQNMRYANDVQSNDSVWLHANLPTVMYKGRMGASRW